MVEFNSNEMCQKMHTDLLMQKAISHVVLASLLALVRDVKGPLYLKAYTDDLYKQIENALLQLFDDTDIGKQVSRAYLNDLLNGISGLKKP